jgi:hypothetical protein
MQALSMSRYMDKEHSSEPGTGRAPQGAGPGPGKQTLVEQAYVPPVQRRAKGPPDEAAVHARRYRIQVTDPSFVSHIATGDKWSSAAY